jgi:lipopolysaccharide export system permease protein
MRLLDRYIARQLLPVWVWCLTVFVSLSCLIDLFEHLDEILRYHITAQTVLRYYVSFAPLVIVRASPLALLLGGSFIAMRLSRYHELLAMSASGTSLLRASLPFVFVGWLVSLMIFVVGDAVLPGSLATYEQLRQEAFRSKQEEDRIENVAIMDASNRLYHARLLDLKTNELRDLTVLEHDWHNTPTRSLYAHQALWTAHGWLLVHGTIYEVGPRGALRGEPEPFTERLMRFPVTPESFRRPDTKPEMMRYAKLRLLVTRLKRIKINNLRRYQTELAAKLTLPLMNLIVCLIAFAGSTQQQLRGHLKGLGTSLGWGMAYYVLAAAGQGLAKEGFLRLPVWWWVWLPHAVAVWWCIRTLRKAA